MEVAIAPDCEDREAIDWFGTSRTIAGEHIRDLMLTIEKRIHEPSERVSQKLSDNGSLYMVRNTRNCETRQRESKRTPARSPQSNGMAESFVRILGHGFASPGAVTVLRDRPLEVEDYNERHPHEARGN